MRLSGPVGAFRGYVRAVADEWTAVILSGGSSARMGFDKASAPLAGRSLLEWLLQSIPAGIACVVVGPDPGATSRPVTVTREEPPGAGPVAGLAAGMAEVRTPLVAVVAVDMPFAAEVLPQLIEQLAACRPDVDAVLPADGSGRVQPLAGAYRADAVRRCLRSLGPLEGRAVRHVVSRLTVLTIPTSATAVLKDVDTQEDLADLRRSVRATRQGSTSHRKDGDMAKDGDMDEWVVAATKALGIEQAVDVDLILDVAREAAHGVARPAAPVTTFLLGCAVAAGQAPEEAAARLTLLAREWPTE
jgi:molybdopterin-guanine dinucleotide biosynthesis protein A